MFCEDSVSSFYAKLLTDRQTDRRTDKRRNITVLEEGKMCAKHEEFARNKSLGWTDDAEHIYKLSMFRGAVGASWFESDKHGLRSYQFGVGRAQVWRRFSHHCVHRRDLSQRQHHGMDGRCPRWRQLPVSRVGWPVGERPVFRANLLGEPGWPL